MVTVGSEGQRYGGSSQKATGRAREIMLECLPFLHPQPLLFPFLTSISPWPKPLRHHLILPWTPSLGLVSQAPSIPCSSHTFCCFATTPISSPPPRPPITSILVPHRQDTEHKGTECGCKESSPVIPNGKVGRGDLDAEQHSYGAGKQVSADPPTPLTAGISGAAP